MPSPEHHCSFPHVPSIGPIRQGGQVFECPECFRTYDLNTNVCRWYHRTPWTPPRLISQ